MTPLIALVPAVAFMGFTVWKFMASEWSGSWRTRRSGPSNNWQNENYMAKQDGMSWSEIDGAIANDAPPRRVGY